MKGLFKKDYIVVINGLGFERAPILNGIFPLIPLVTKRKKNDVIVTGWTQSETYILSYRANKKQHAELQRLFKEYYPNLRFTYISK